MDLQGDIGGCSRLRSGVAAVREEQLHLQRAVIDGRGEVLDRHEGQGTTRIRWIEFAALSSNHTR